MDFKQVIFLRARIAFLGILLFALAVVAKLVYIQFIQGQQWQKSAQEATLELRPIKPTRGHIYAIDGSLLATSLPFYRVAFDPCIADEELFRNNVAELSNLLASFYQDKSAKAYQASLQGARRAKRRYLLLNSQQITHQTQKMMSQWPIFNSGRWLGGVIFEKTEKRFKPFQDLAYRTIGFVNEEGNGVGIEYSFDQMLKGIEGSALYQKMVGGNWKMLYNSATNKPIDGYDIETTLDINLQDVAHQSLLKVLVASQANYGCAIVMEVATGEIKAMVNLGRTADGYKEIYNYAVGAQGNTEPGSSFKLISMLALLEETSIALTDTVDTGDGTYQFHNLTMHDTKVGGYGVITTQEVFEKSSNIGMAKLIDSTFSQKPQKFIDYIHKLGLHQPLGFQLTGEGVPFIKNPKSSTWTGVTLPWMSMGYELKLTPLQILTVYNAVANRGKMLKPIIIKRVKQANRVVQEFKSSVIHPKICTDATLQKLQIMLEGVVERGTAQKFKHGFYKLAGKSGTSNKLVNGKYGNVTYASFAGYFPADAPIYSCMVVIDNPKGGIYHFGGQVAAPVVKDIADKLSSKDLVSTDYITVSQEQRSTNSPTFKIGHKKELSYLCRELGIHYRPAQTADLWGKLTKQENGSAWQAANIFGDQQVPDVRGMCLKDALFLLENRGLKVVIQGNPGGQVKTQSIMPGTKISSYPAITLELS
jgi:cell division protein FtsI (penicillin-binding protein 3)